MKNSTKFIVVLIILSAIVVTIVSSLNTVNNPLNGLYYLEGDTSVTLSIDEGYYSITGLSDSYVDIIANIEPKGNINRPKTEYTKIIYLITDNPNGPYFSINDKDSITLSTGLNSKIKYVFLRKQ